LNKREPRTVPREDLQRIVAHLAAKRQKLGLSQRELSRRLGMWEMAVHEIESGQRGLQVTEFIDMALILEEDPVRVLRLAMSDPG
jgi:transcriptional regulator with XRE-family HTH domain